MFFVFIEFYIQMAKKLPDMDLLPKQFNSIQIIDSRMYSNQSVRVQSCHLSISNNWFVAEHGEPILDL